MGVWILVAIWASWWVQRRLYFHTSKHVKALRADVGLLNMIADTYPQGEGRKARRAHRRFILAITRERHPKVLMCEYVLAHALKYHIEQLGLLEARSLIQEGP